MKTLYKLILLGTMMLTPFLPHTDSIEVKAIDSTIEEMKKFDENIELGTPYFENGDFNSPFNSHLMYRSGDKYNALYRGVTSVNEKESDIYAFYDKREENTFVRFANYNGTGADRTRMSCYYYNTATDQPSNLRKTSYFNVSFSYRLYASEVDLRNLSSKDVVFMWQSRGSANNKSSNVLLKDLEINEPGDMTWHTYTYRVSCQEDMTTEFGWFFFYYHDFKPSQSPTYYADLDNFSVSLDDGINTVKQNGTFEFLNNGGCYLKGSQQLPDEIYHDFYYREDYGSSIYQDNYEGRTFLRMDASKSKSTFSYEADRNLRKETTIYINFDFKDYSYYKKPDLDIMINGKTGTIFEDIIGKEKIEDNLISYVKEKEDGWKNQSLYITLPAGYLETIDFLLEVECNIGIDNLLMADFISINYSSGDYKSFMEIKNSFVDTIGDYEDKYIGSSVTLISDALKAADKITESSSQSRMDEAIELINKALANLQEKGDIDKVFSYIDQIFDEMAGTNKNNYDLRTYILFKYAIEEAIYLSENDSKEKVDEIYANLVEAYENLIRKDSE